MKGLKKKPVDGAFPSVESEHDLKEKRKNLMANVIYSKFLFYELRLTLWMMFVLNVQPNY